MIVKIVGDVGDGVGWKNVSRFLCGELLWWRIVGFVTQVEFLFCACWKLLSRGISKIFFFFPFLPHYIRELLKFFEPRRFI